MMAKFENSKADKKMDSKKGAPKEGSKADMKADKKMMGSYKKGGMVKGRKGY
jgi:hypothetical protein